MAGLTASLGHFVANANAIEIPEAALRTIKTGFIDTIATMLAGRGEPVVRILDGLTPAGVEASILLGGRRASARDAALLNGVAGHALDFDDVALLGHPSTVLVPVVLAEGERLNCSGAQMLRAYLVGYEVWAELTRREADPIADKGWHATGVFGAIAAAASAAFLNGADAAVASHALGIGASLGSGLVANFGSMTKPFHAGSAAAHGIDAARMAAAGMTASPDAIEHPAGFLTAISPYGNVDREAPCTGLGTQLRILESGLSIKKYPMCYATHRAIDGMIAVANAHDLRPEDIAEVSVAFSPTQGAILRNHRPQTGLEAKFSIEFAMAAAVAERWIGLAQLSDAYVRSGVIRSMLGKVGTRFIDAPLPGENGLSLTEQVEVVTVDGRMLSSEAIKYATGHAKSPLAPADLWKKFSDCTAGVNWVDAPRLFERLGDFEKIENVGHLLS